MKGFFTELTRRNVYKVAVEYALVAWLLIQIASVLFPTFEAAGMVMKVFVGLSGRAGCWVGTGTAAAST